MTQAEVLAQVETIFQKVLKRDNIQLTETATTNDVDGWNSLSHMMIIAEVEAQFGIKFSFREMVKFKNVGDLCNAIVSKKQ
ncbi:acyl carrier protein [Alistipes sp. ZOR0009]|jgi:acyl carrier protein|uniref:acyl carrier protein n=1 Tax=Alistipes sp. ZOR0009 TaxID=1339253 RepID=UPI000647050E|nr:acyl carrier protein [Alistipes sp. ZOR0009]